MLQLVLLVLQLAPLFDTHYCVAVHALVDLCARTSVSRCMHWHTSAYVSIRQHTSAYVCARISIRQHTSAYVCARISMSLYMH